MTDRIWAWFWAIVLIAGMACAYFLVDLHNTRCAKFIEGGFTRGTIKGSAYTHWVRSELALTEERTKEILANTQSVQRITRYIQANESTWKNKGEIDRQGRKDFTDSDADYCYLNLQWLWRLEKAHVE